MVRDGTTPKPRLTTHCITNNSHEFPCMSWYAAHMASAEAREAVYEETDHRIVWGLACGAPPVTVAVGSKKVTVHVRTMEGHTVVGLQEEAAFLLELVITSPRPDTRQEVDELVNSFVEKAHTAYEDHFKLQGLCIYYTRKVYENVKWNLHGVLPSRGVSTVFLDKGLEKDILQDARTFLGDREAYTRFGRPFKRVYCLHGPPGTGKSSIVTAIASELHRPLAIFNTDSLRDDTFIELLTNCPKDAVFLFEDVDALFRSRDTDKDTGGMTFSTMLNALDGVLHPPGAIVFLTTNHLDRPDAAVHRPGRVDRLIEVGYATPSTATAMWRSIFGRHPVPPVLLSTETKIVPAQLSEILFRHRESAGSVASAWRSGRTRRVG